jgi:microcystin-dependent protein
MPSDSTSPLLGLLLMATGNDNNNWGTSANTDVFIPLENAIAGTTVLSGLTGGTVTLTAAQAAQSMLIELQGVLTSNLTIVVPSTSKKWTFINQTTGTFVTLINAGGANRNIPQSRWVDMISDGTGNIRRGDGHNVGEIFYFGATTPPGGSILCNGAAISRTAYIDLYNAIGTTWGVGDGVTTFNVPNGYAQGSGLGSFLRSSTASVATGTYQANQNKTHTHTDNGSAVTAIENAVHVHFGSGTTLSDSPPHEHNYTATGQNSAIGTGGGAFGVVPSPLTFNASAQTGTPSTPHTHAYSFTTGTETAYHAHPFTFTTSAGSADGAEARPEALTATMAIRY